MKGLPTQVQSPEWRDWLEAFPAYPDHGRSSLMRYERGLVDHLKSSPDASLLGKQEARQVGEDLLLYCHELQARQEADADVGLINFGVALSGFFGAVFFPPAAIPLASISLAAAALASSQAYEQRRRKTLISAILSKLYALSWRLRQSK